MSQFDAEKLIAELEAQQSKLDAELELLGLGNLDDIDPSQQWKDYPEIVRISYEASDDQLTDALARLIDKGEDVNAKSPFGETALEQCFARSAFDAVSLLIAHGADHSMFEWSEDHLRIVMGNTPDVSAGSTALINRDAAGRSPFLLACRVGNVAAAKHLQPLTPEEGKYATPDNEGVAIIAARSGSIEMLNWALAKGYDVNEEDRFGATALLEAVEYNFLPVAHRLLEAGADTSRGRNITRANAEHAENQNADASIFGKAADLIMNSTMKFLPDFVKDMDDCIVTPANAAHNPEMLRLLAQHGVPLEEFDNEDVPVITGADRIAKTKITPEMFNLQAMPKVGQTNPERVDIPFWREQIRTGRSGYAGEVDCVGERKYHTTGTPVWSFNRFGRTGTLLPDGRWVLIAGEHEDHYDPDFCIYADVTIIHPDASVDHFIYPEAVFPPTDFHTATLLGDHILLIGSLGYQGKRHEGRTQVLRLNLDDFSISKVETSGQNPGWISRHTATMKNGHIIVTGGKVEPGYVDNTNVFALNLSKMAWSRQS